MSTVLSVFGIRPSKIGGQEAFARELSRQLNEHGWRSVLCFASFPPEAVRRYLTLANVHLEVLDEAVRPTSTNLRALASMLPRHRPDVLHLYYTGFISPYPWLARLGGVKRVLFTDELSREALQTPRRAPGWKRVAARLINWPLGRVVCASHYVHRCLTTMDLLPAERFQVIYNAVETDGDWAGRERGVDFRRTHEIPLDRLLVVKVAWMIPEKGIVDLLEAARLVLTRRTDVHFALVGDGPRHEEYKRRAADLSLNDHVTWTGLVQDPVREGVYAAADVACHVARWEEVFGYVIAEAMACSRPVIGTRVGGIPELIEEGRSGFLVPREAPAEIADRILELLANEALRARFGQAGREIVLQKFSLSRNVTALLDLYGLS
jgi:glycosyltransferase involved in cell wall biosynthesis